MPPSDPRAKNTLSEMISELFKRKYKQEMTVYKTRESKVDLKKETSTGMMNIQSYQPKARENLLGKHRNLEEKERNTTELNNLYIERAMETMGRLEGLPPTSRIDAITETLDDVKTMLYSDNEEL